MTVPLSPMFDPTDNPYLPRSLQNIRLAIDPNDLAFPHPIPAFPIAAYAPAILAGGPISMNGQETAYGAHNIGNNSPVILDPLEEDDFPNYFQQLGSPPRLFHSHGSSYVLPVDSDETKVCHKTPAYIDEAFSLAPNLRGRKLNISCSV